MYLNVKHTVIWKKICNSEVLIELTEFKNKKNNFNILILKYHHLTENVKLK